MGWNSWDAYGTTVNESQFKANAQWLADHLKSSGWQYVVVDMEWFVTNPLPEGNSTKSQFSLDDQGRYTPAINRFPSAAGDAGFKPLADYVHGLGLKFGIHILRGIPKKAVEQNFAIEGSSYRAADAADTHDVCPWNPDNFGTDSSKPAAQAYYDSIARLYASWAVDLIKADCISSRPYKGDDIRMLSLAIGKTGRPIVLSLSPGAAPIGKQVGHALALPGTESCPVLGSSRTKRFSRAAACGQCGLIASVNGIWGQFRRKDSQAEAWSAGSPNGKRRRHRGRPVLAAQVLGENDEF